ncbi:hypothetical protein MJH54_30950, partial [Salmonella enterica subsp. enterica serovar Montevideo]|nr:hypothetical protein [Salmonella enterica subsp. enterica serovar Montevideo]
LHVLKKSERIMTVWMLFKSVGNIGFLKYLHHNDTKRLSWQQCFTTALHYKAYLRVGLIMKPELISDHQLAAVPRNNPSQ